MKRPALIQPPILCFEGGIIVQPGDVLNVCLPEIRVEVPTYTEIHYPPIVIRAEVVFHPSAGFKLKILGLTEENGALWEGNDLIWPGKIIHFKYTKWKWEHAIMEALDNHLLLQIGWAMAGSPPRHENQTL